MRALAHHPRRTQDGSSTDAAKQGQSSLRAYARPVVASRFTTSNGVVSTMNHTREQDPGTGSPSAGVSDFAYDFTRIPVHPYSGRSTRIAQTPVDGRCLARNDAAKPSRQGVSSASTGTAAENAEDVTAPTAGEPADSQSVDPLAGLPGSPSACVAHAAMPYSRSGILRWPTGTVGEQFQVRAEWQSAPVASRGETSYCAAECGEYHQFVKGHIFGSANADGSNLQDDSAKLFGGAHLDENVFQEDGLDDNPAARYGHRAEPRTMDETYEPTRASGPKYVGNDFPNLSIGTFADIDLTFLGTLADTCNATESPAGTWRVKYRGIIRP
jgi:hypothetical protein